MNPKSIILIIVITFTTHAQWERKPFPEADNPQGLIETSQGLLALSQRTIYVSSDNGNSWSALSSTSPAYSSTVLEANGVLLANTSRMRIFPHIVVPSLFRSDDSGKNWFSVSDAVYGGQSIAIFNSKIYADLDGKLYCSSDTGRTWELIDTSNFFPNQITEIIGGGCCLYVRIGSHAIYRKNTATDLWDSLEITFPSHFYNVIAKDSSLYVGTFSDGFYISNDIGNTWQEASIGLPDSSGIRALYMLDSSIIASISEDFQQSIYKFDLQELKWSLFNEGFSLQRLKYIFGFAANGEYLFALTDSTLWLRSISNLSTSIEHYNDVTKSYQTNNYPNPFNSSTKIVFTLNNSSDVTLSIYNMLGQEIKTISAGNLTPGTHNLAWNGTNRNNEPVSSGIYIYRLQVKDNTGKTFSKSAKIVLIK